MGDMLKGRVAVITGAGNGLGRAYALSFAAQGAGVVVNDIGTSHDGYGVSHDAADAVVEKIKKDSGTAVANYGSVAVEDEADSIIQCAIDNYGRIDVLVNNAGIIRVQDIGEINTTDWDAVIRAHLYGTFYCTRKACGYMRKQGYGRIINTSSHVGLGLKGQSTYSAAKEGITGFSRSIARDMAEYGVTCNIIRPVAAWRGVVQKIDAVEALRPEDVAALVTYLASESADHINGCVFEVWRGHVGIFVEPPPVAQVLWKDGHWTPEELQQTIPGTLTKGRSREDLPYTLPWFFKPPEE
ncbi:MAG TPA: SDR family NAD(P)-dependent oxidoreductase [Dehalococcoidia bacterium]|nr:SDR family NAD(P)-dependent oxidoreductase [Dehalococcoidia bacterium]